MWHKDSMSFLQTKSYCWWCKKINNYKHYNVFQKLYFKGFFHLLPRFCLIPECGLSWPCGRPECTTVDMPKRFCRLLSHLNLRDQRTNPPCSSERALAINANIFCLAYRINSDLFATHAAVLTNNCLLLSLLFIYFHEKKKYSIIQRLWLTINTCASYYDVSWNKAI